MISFIIKWFNYIFKRNPFRTQEEEHRYVKKVFVREGAPYKNWLLEIKPIPKKNYFYIEMKSRGCGYIFEILE